MLLGTDGDLSVYDLMRGDQLQLSRQSIGSI